MPSYPHYPQIFLECVFEEYFSIMFKYMTYFNKHQEQQIFLQRLKDIQIEQLHICSDFEQKHKTGHQRIYGLTTAARLCGIEEPKINIKKYPRLSSQRLQVVIPDKNKRQIHNINNPQLEYFIANVPLFQEEIANGIVCASPIANWFLFAPWLSLFNLIILGDSLLRRNTVHGRITLEEIDHYLELVEALPHRKRAPKGIVKAKQARYFMRENTDSSQEVRLRLLFVMYGLPCPVVNYECITNDGLHVFFDLAYVEAKIVIEYDGAFHSEQWLKDSSRRRSIEESGWVYIQVTKADLATEECRQKLVSYVAKRLGERLNRRIVITSRMSLESLYSAYYLK